MTYSNWNFCWGTDLNGIFYTALDRNMIVSLAFPPRSGLQFGFLLSLLPLGTGK